MLNLDEILKAYPPELRRFRRFLLREFLQYKILNVIFSIPAYANKLSFLGGTCLRIVHNNTRFSEDLDFDNFSLTEIDFEAISGLIKTSLEREGFEIEIRNVFKGAFRCYIRFPNLLFPLGLTGLKEEKILIQLDTHPQHFNFNQQSFILNKFDVFTEIFVTPPDLLLAQKCYTILNRKRSKGRDFYDAVFLFGKVEPNYDYLTAKAGISTPAQLKEKLLATCAQISLKEMADDVLPFLFREEDKKKVELFDKYLVQVL